MKTIKDINELEGKIVFVRSDFNVPIVDGAVGDDFRLIKSFELIDFLLNARAKIILASHIEGGDKTLRPIFKYLKDRYKISFVENYFPETPEFDFSESKIILLENLRQYDGEVKNDEDFSKHLASFADLYINEAFPVSHREHASIVGIPKYISSFAGPVFERETSELARAFNPEHPFLFVLGGAKFDTKLPLVRKFFNLADYIFIGGALANDFFRAKGLNTGHSLLSEIETDLTDFLGDKLILPIDVIVENGGKSIVKKVEDVLPEDTISDVGPESIALLRDRVSSSKFILWNGPLGNYERGFKESTMSLAKIIADSSAMSIVGGGDTVASIAELHVEDKFSFVSTAGGAMLDFLANETVPGINALNG